jgi:hypothetical protein
MKIYTVLMGKKYCKDYNDRSWAHYWILMKTVIKIFGQDFKTNFSHVLN